MRTTIEETLPIKLPSNSYSPKWDNRFLEVARLVSTWSKDPSTKVGAVAVGSDRRIIAQGYNGFNSGSKDLLEDYENRETKYQNVIHAESNIIFNSCNHQVSLRLATVFLFGTYPCPECVKALAQVGIARIVFQLGQSSNQGFWKQNFEISKRIMRELQVGYTHYSCCGKPEHVKELMNGNTNEGIQCHGS